MTAKYRVVFDGRIEKSLAAAPRHVLERFLSSVHELELDPRRPRPGLDSKRLKGPLGAFYRLRIGDWRILYVVDDHERTVVVTSAGPRKRSY